jgi:hypothetical protein
MDKMRKEVIHGVAKRVLRLLSFREEINSSKVFHFTPNPKISFGNSFRMSFTKLKSMPTCVHACIASVVALICNSSNAIALFCGDDAR